jgi:hypothetical protein
MAVDPLEKAVKTADDEFVETNEEPECVDDCGKRVEKASPSTVDGSESFTQEPQSEEEAQAINEELDEKAEVIEIIEDVVEEDGVTPSMVKLCHKLGFDEVAKRFNIDLDTTEANITDELVTNLKATLAASKKALLDQKVTFKKK